MSYNVLDIRGVKHGVVEAELVREDNLWDKSPSFIDLKLYQVVCSHRRGVVEVKGGWQRCTPLKPLSAAAPAH